MDKFLDSNTAQAVYNEFEYCMTSKRDSIYTKKYTHRNVFRKIGTQVYPDNSKLGTIMKYLISEEFTSKLRMITGIEDLHADPNYYGGGITEMFPGGYLKCHKDFNKHSGTGQYRKLNLLVYLNPEWPITWGGGIQLWCPKHQKLLTHIYGSSGDAVLFETSEISYHQVPPINPSAIQPRRALALYYFSNSWPVGVAERTMTDYQLTPYQWATLIEIVFHLRAQSDDLRLESIQKCRPSPWTYQKSDIIIANACFKRITELFGSSRSQAINNLKRIGAQIEHGEDISSLDEKDHLLAKILASLESDETKGDSYTEDSFS